ncbi:MAG: hypothetical protein HY720_24665, partial [Planctomycetes bacterium]|nr:hypothetical protein [Planctomycetota bacterium]
MDKPIALRSEGPRALVHLLRDRADRTPERPFVRVLRRDDLQDEMPWSYGAFWRGVQAAGASLQERGLEPGERVLLVFGGAEGFL